MSFVAFGDSITFGYPVAPSQIWAKIVSDALGMSLTNFAISSSQASDQAFVAQSHSPSAANIYGIMLGVNDVTVYGDNATKRAAYVNHMRALIAWLSFSAKTTAQAATKAGSWTNFTPIGSSTTTVGSTASASIGGNALYIGFRNQANSESDGAVSEIFVDGVQVASRVGNGLEVGPTVLGSDSGNPNYHGRAYGPQAVRVNGLGSGEHSALVRHATGGKATLLESFAGSLQPENPTILVLNIPTRNPDVAWRASYNQSLSALVQELAADGRDVRLVDIASLLTSSHLAPDNLHINAAGHELIAAAAVAALAPVSQFQPYRRSGLLLKRVPSGG